MEEKRFRLIERVIRNISHEIKNPLTSIKGYSQLLEKKSADEFSLKAAAVINEQIQHLEDKLDEVYNVFSYKSSQYELVVVQNVIDDLIRDSEINEFISHSPRIEPYSIRTDRNLFIQLILIFLNSINRDFYPQTRIFIEYSGKDPSAAIDVIYSGIELPQEELTQIFLPYSTKSLFTTGCEFL
jgi:signal transduction histidine kinase